MLYIVCGPARSGKTTACLRLHERLGLPFLPLDAIVMGFSNGMPGLGVQAEAPAETIAKGIWPFTRALMANLIEIGLEYIIEGEPVMPETILELARAYPGCVKAAALGYPSLTPEEKLRLCREHPGEMNDWTTGLSDAELLDFLGRCITDSRETRRRAESSGIPYFDSSFDYPAAVDAAVRSLLEGPPLG